MNTMLKRMIGVFVTVGATLAVLFLMMGGPRTGQAQTAATNTVDVGVAVMAMRSLVSAQTLVDLQKNPQYIQNYQGLMLDQELAQEAMRRGLTERIDVIQMIDMARRGVLIQALREDIARRLPQPSDSEVKARYDRTKTQWVLPEAFRLDVFRIRTNDVNTFRMVKALGGRPFTNDLAALISTNGVPVVTKETGWVTAANMTPTVWEGLLEMKLDHVDIFPDGPSFLVIRRGENRGEQQLTLDQARNDIANLIYREKEQLSWQAYLEGKREELGLGAPEAKK